MRWIATVLLLSLLAGCAEEAEPEDGTPTSEPAPGQPGASEPIEYRCTADVGAPVVSLETAVANIGGCSLVTLSKQQAVVESAPGASCTIQVDLDGDALADEQATVGSVYDSGTSFTAFCDPPAVGAENVLLLADP